MKKCTYCAEDIQDAAIVCRYCGRDLPAAVAAVPPTAPSPPAPRKTGVPWWALGFVGLLGLSIVMSFVTRRSRERAAPPPVAEAPASVAPPVTTTTVAPVVGAQWRYLHETDEMSGKMADYAQVESENTVEFGFPYNGVQHGRLQLRRHPRHGKDVLFSVEKGQILCHTHDNCTVLVRFDDEAAKAFSASPPSDHSTTTVFIGNYERFVTKLKTAKRVRISPQFYQQGSVVFEFNVEGFDTVQYVGQAAAAKEGVPTGSFEIARTQAGLVIKNASGGAYMGCVVSIGKAKSEKENLFGWQMRNYLRAAFEGADSLGPDAFLSDPVAISCDQAPSGVPFKRTYAGEAKSTVAPPNPLESQQ